MIPVSVGPIRPGELSAAVGVLARGMRDNPMHVAAFGDDPERRVLMLERMFEALFRTMDNAPLVARREREVVGVLGIAESPACMPTGGQTLRLLPVILRSGPASAARLGRWLRAWADRDPQEPHSHLGPVAVDAGLQRQGIGSRMMAAYCDFLDEGARVGYLETDKAVNVAFYALSGFETVARAQVLGVENWFMRRQPRLPPAA